ncbi:ArsR/SmtB family transcription factor [Rhizobium sp. PAMB 3182]
MTEKKALTVFCDEAARMLTAFANPKRLMILNFLLMGEVAVGDLAERVELSQSALSQHLSKLRAQKLVATRREAQTIYYSSNSEAVARLMALLNDLHAAKAMHRDTAA